MTARRFGFAIFFIWGIVVGMVMVIALIATAKKAPADEAETTWQDPAFYFGETSTETVTPHKPRVPPHTAQRKPQKSKLDKIMLPVSRPMEAATVSGILVTDGIGIPKSEKTRPIESVAVVEPDLPPTLRCRSICVSHTCKPTEWCMPTCRNICEGDN